VGPIPAFARGLVHVDVASYATQNFEVRTAKIKVRTAKIQTAAQTRNRHTEDEKRAKPAGDSGGCYSLHIAPYETKRKKQKGREGNQRKSEGAKDAEQKTVPSGAREGLV